MAMVPKRWMLLGIPLVLGAMLLLWMTPTGERFKEIFSEKGDNGSQRIEIWDAAIQMTKDNPWFGVGPGNFQNVIETYDSQLARMFSHNSFLNVLAETGVIGLLLYLSVFLIGAFQLGKAIHRHRREWREQATWFVAGGIVAFLVISLFLTRHLMTIAYILLGCSSVLARTPSKSIPKDDASGESPNGISRVFHSTP
jgi:O-antigen ligase